MDGSVQGSTSHEGPRDPRNVWRVIDALGVWREVASERNARSKAAAFNRTCPPRECPHRVERWNGKAWF